MRSSRSVVETRSTAGSERGPKAGGIKPDLRIKSYPKPFVLFRRRFVFLHVFF